MTQRAPRSQLLLLVYLISLLLLLTLGGGLALLASAHVSSSAIGASASADRALVQAVLADLGPAVTDETLTASATARVESVLRRAIEDVGLIGIAVSTPDGVIRSTAGDVAWPSEARIASDTDRPSATLVDGPERPLLVETFPAMVDGRVVAVIGIVRDGRPLLASAAAAQGDIAIGTAAGATVLIVVLFLVFRDAQRRLDRQTEQLLESERRDPLTGLLTHGAAIAALAEALDREDEAPVAIALVDIDNFRRINDTHGHELGDTALCTIASIVGTASSQGAIVGRSGPDEFLMTAPGLDAGQLTALVEAARHRLADVVLHTMPKTGCR